MSRPSPEPLASKSARLDAAVIRDDLTPGEHSHYHQLSEPLAPELDATSGSEPLGTPSTLPYASSPPPLIHSKSPYARISLPPMVPKDEGVPTVHSILKSGSDLIWDVRRSPMESLANLNSSFGVLSSSTRLGSQQQLGDEPASWPALSSFVIRTDTIADRPLVVFPSDTEKPFVTVFDILWAVHRAIWPGFVEFDDEQQVPENGSQSLEGASSRVRRPSTREPINSEDSGREDAGDVVATTRGSGWRWGGLTASETEMDVWILTLF